MNIEDLKGMITVVADLGDGATEAVDSMVGLMILSEVTGAFLGLIFMGLVAYMIKWTIERTVTPAYRMRQLRDAADIGMEGPLTDREFAEMLQMIRKGQGKNS